MEGFEFNQDQQQPMKPDNNMPLAIIGTIIGLCSPCCIGLIVGIVGIVFASQVNSKYQAGDFIGAMSSAKNARILAFIALGLGVLGLIIGVIQIIMAGGFAAYLEQYQNMLDSYR